MRNVLTNEIENFYCLKLPIDSTSKIYEIFSCVLRTKKNPINPVGPILQVVIIGRIYINHTDAIAKHKREREILMASNFLLNLNPLTNPS